jgi:hypothetical protein
LKCAKEPGKVSQSEKRFILNAVRVEMHYIIPDLPDPIQALDEYPTVEI